MAERTTISLVGGLTLRLLLSYAALAAICLFLVATPLLLMRRRDYVSRAVERFNYAVHEALPQLREAAERDDPRAFDRICEELNRRFNGRVTILGRDGRVLGDSIGGRCAARARPECIPAIRGKAAATAVAFTPERDTVTVQVPFILGARGRVIARLVLPLAPIRGELLTIRRLLITAGIVAACLTLCTGVIVARRIARPIEEMTALAERIAGGDFGHTLSIPRRDEIGRLGAALDEMRRNLRRTLQDLARERNQALAMVRSLTDGVIALDAGANILFTNPAARRLAPWLGESDGRTTEGGVTSLDAWPEPLRKAVRAVLDGGEPGTVELGDPMRGERSIRAEVQPVDVHAGVVVVLHDVTELRRTEHMARDLVANASHELRTPTAVIASTAETLCEQLDEEGRADLREFADIILRQARRMQALVDETLQLSRLDMAASGEDAEPTPVQEIVSQAMAGVRPLAEQNRIVLEAAEVPDDLVIECVPQFMAQALRNLLDNAVRYSPAGSRVRLTVEVEDDTWLSFIVDDSGPGIPENERSALLDPFVRGGTGERTNPAGVGLGLAIVSRVARVHGGVVEVGESPFGGARFVLRIPLAGRRQTVQTPPPSTDSDASS